MGLTLTMESQPNQISIEEAIEFVDNLVHEKTKKNLKDYQIKIFKGIWKGLTYQQIAEENHFELSTISNDYGYKLLKLLTNIFEEKVTQGNLKPVVEKLFKKQKTNPPSLDNRVNYSFVGREEAFNDLDDLVRQGAKVIVIQAAGGVGKTTVAREYLDSQKFDLLIELPMAKEEKNITPVQNIVEDWLKKHFNDQPAPYFSQSLDRLQEHLKKDKKVGIFIDNLEPALDKGGAFIEEHKDYRELLRRLNHKDVRSLTLITSRDTLNENIDGASVVINYRLPSLNKRAWEDFFKAHLSFSEEETSRIKRMHEVYGGNALAMQLLYGQIRKQFNGNITGYWAEYGARYEGDLSKLPVPAQLEKLVIEQFDRLEKLDHKKHELLCRLGCYRYQDLPTATIPQKGLLYLLWDVPEAEGMRRIDYLQDLSLIESKFIESKGKQYWLHPVVREVAIARLKASEDWQKANRKAAEFWTGSVKTVETLEDVQKAFEAYHHYCNIDEFNSAAEVISTPRENQFYKIDDGEYLSNSFDRLGLSHSLELNINAIIEKIDPQSSTLAILNHTLGVQYYFIGDINKSIEYNQKSIAQMKQCLENNAINNDVKRILRLNITSALIGIALCKLSLCEFQEALKHLDDSISMCKQEENQFDFQVKAFESFLAFLYSCPDPKCSNPKESERLANIIYEDIFKKKRTEDILKMKRMKETTSRGKAYMLFFLGGTYKNLGNFERAKEIYKEAIKYFNQSQYTQFKGRVLTNQAELYREAEQFTDALSTHNDSINLLTKIGAKYDLAEAYFQRALTYQKMGNMEESKSDFKEALKLFQEINIPKQIERVMTYAKPLSVG